jgi:hypothetical protein
MLRFTIRDVLWLTALVAMGVGWWTTHVRIVSRLAESERREKSATEYAAGYKLLRRLSVEAGLVSVHHGDGTVRLERVAAPVPPGSLDLEQ